MKEMDFNDCTKRELVAYLRAIPRIQTIYFGEFIHELRFAITHEKAEDNFNKRMNLLTEYQQLNKKIGKLGINKLSISEQGRYLELRKEVLKKDIQFYGQR